MPGGYKWKAESMIDCYSCAWGTPPLNCNICGSNVYKEKCDKHECENGVIALRDKYLKMFILRFVNATG